MDDVIVFNNIQGNEVTLRKDEYDYTVYINDEIVMSTGDETEAEMIGESLDVALSILDSHHLLRPRN